MVYVDDDINSSIVITPLSFLSLSHQHFVSDCMTETDTDFQVTHKLNTGQQILERWRSGQRYLREDMEKRIPTEPQVEKSVNVKTT